MSVFNGIEWIKRSNTDMCLHYGKEVAAYATKFKPGHLCFLGVASENTWWNGNSNGPLALHMVDMFKCHTSHPIFSDSHCRLDSGRKGGRNEHFHGTENIMNLMETLIMYLRTCDYSACEFHVHIFEGNEAVVKHIYEGISPTMRHVSRTRLVDSDWLYDRINLDPMIQIK